MAIVEIKRKVEELEKLGITGDNPINENSTDYYNIEIINSNVTIKTHDLSYNLEDEK